MKTILINLFDTTVAKNMFMPAFREALAAREDVRCVVIVPQSKLEELKKDLEGPRIEIVARPQQYASPAEVAALFLARNSIPTWTVRQIQKEGLDGSGQLPLPKYIIARIFWMLGHSYLFRELLKKISAYFFDESVFLPILDTYHPDLLFATTTYAVDDIRLLKAARHKGIKTIGMIKSWDNLSSKDLLLVAPERLIVHNEAVKAELTGLHHYPSGQINVVGVPQFDWYAGASFLLSREDFFRGMHLDLERKLITYTAMGEWIVPHERDVIALLHNLVTKGSLRSRAQLLVRMHPAYPDNIQELRTLFPGTIFDEPGSPVRDPNNLWKADWKFSIDDVRHLASTLAYSDVTLNCGSTTMLDAVCFDTPVIGIAFDGTVAEPSYWLSARRLFDREHCKVALASGGVQLAYNEQELAHALDRYLADRSEGADGRKRLVELEAGEIGQASARLGEAVLSALK